MSWYPPEGRRGYIHTIYYIHPLLYKSSLDPNPNGWPTIVWRLVIFISYNKCGPTIVCSIGISGELCWFYTQRKEPVNAKGKEHKQSLKNHNINTVFTWQGKKRLDINISKTTQHFSLEWHVNFHVGETQPDINIYSSTTYSIYNAPGIKKIKR